MAPKMREIINELTIKYGKIKPCGMAGTWNNSIEHSVHNDDLLLWFETSDGTKHMVRISKDWKIINIFKKGNL